MDEKKLLKKKRIYTETSDYQNLANVHESLGKVYAKQGQYEKAASEYEMQAKAFEKLNKHMASGIAYRNSGEMYLELENPKFSKALSHVEIYLEKAKKENNKLEMQRAYCTLGRVYLLNGQISKKDDESNIALRHAEKAFLKSLLICNKLKGEVKTFELNDMQARLFLNLGVTKDTQNLPEDAMKFIDKAISMSKEHELYELHHKCCLTLSTVYSTKLKDSAKALKVINTAMEIASRLENSREKICETYLAKAEVIIKMGDYHSARATLKKAYHLKTSCEADQIMIDTKLKLLVASCNLEEQLVTTENVKEKRKMYEKMGDLSCKLGNYEKSIEFYLKTLECAQLNGEFGRDLIPIYVSLYATYRDNREYDKALDYIWKEYELVKYDPKEAMDTYLNIAKVMELQKKTCWDILRIYRKAQEEAKNMSSLEDEKTVIIKIIKNMRANSMDIVANEEIANARERGIFIDEDDEKDSENGESEDEASTPDIVNDINLNNLSESDVEEEERKATVNVERMARKRGSNFVLKKNPKGETPLQQATIKNNKILVKKLIEQGHPVNVRDYAGWTPLHEASSHGLMEIAQMLIDAGAKINDRGGTSCQGYTPLYDCCVNGKLEMAELLLRHGANATLLTDSGDNPLNALKSYFLNYPDQLNKNNMELYESVCEKLSQALERVGILVQTEKNNEVICKTDDNISNASKSTKNKINNTPTTSYSALVSDSDTETYSRIQDSDSPSPSPVKNQNLNPRTRIISDSSDSDDNGRKHVQNYKQAMNNLRRHSSTNQANKTPSVVRPKRSALLAEDDIDVDEWLIDDLPSKKKAKRDTGFSDQENVNVFNVLMKNSSKSTYASSKPVRRSSQSNRKSLSQSKSQKSLFESGVSSSSNQSVDLIDDDDDLYIPSPRSIEKNTSVATMNFSQLVHTQPFVGEKVLNQSPTLAIPDDLFKIKIRKEFVYVSVSKEERIVKTIEWLENCASLQYALERDLTERPKLTILDTDGSHFGAGTTILKMSEHGRTFDGCVTGNMEITADERFGAMCKRDGIKVNDRIVEALKEAEENKMFTLPKNSTLNKKILLKNVIDTLKYMKTITKLDLSFNQLEDDDLIKFVEVITNIVKLEKIDLSNNSLSDIGMSYLVAIFERDQLVRPLRYVKELDLSFNPLFDESLSDLFRFCNSLDNLKVLKLSFCHLTSLVLNDFQLSMKKLVKFDISGNEIDSISIDYILNNLNAMNLNDFHGEIFPKAKIVDFFKEQEEFPLKVLDLNHCGLKDSDLDDILKCICKCKNLENLDISYNKDLTATSLINVLQCSSNFSLKSVSFVGCRRILDTLKNEMLNHLDSADKFPKMIILSSLDNDVIEKKKDLLNEIAAKMWGQFGKLTIKGKILKIICNVN